MKEFSRLLVVPLLLLGGTVYGQVVVSGQASAGFGDGEGGDSQYVLDEGRPTFLWRGDLFVDILLADDIAFLSNFRILQDQELRVDLFALRFSDIASTGISLQAGQVDLPFGDLGERRFPKQNPFYRLPLINEHLTTLCASDYNVWVLSPSFALRGDGVPLLDQGLYDVGVKAYGNAGMIEYDIAVINGMLSATGTYGKGGLNLNKGLGVVGRVAVVPWPSLSLGVSYGTGQFMADQSADTSSFLYGTDPAEYPQHIVSVDVAGGFGHFLYYGQAVYNVWEYEKDLRSFGYTAEVSYLFTPRLTLAVRGGGILFKEVSGLTVPSAAGDVSYSGKWDRDVFRLETAVRLRITRDALIKLVYEWNRTFNTASDPPDNLLVLQTVLSF